MARYPAATWRPIPENSSQPAIIPVGVVLHTAVSDTASLHDYWARDAVHIESHFYVQERGGVEQYVDTAIRADCQLDGNSWTRDGKRYGFISVESWDDYPHGWANASDVPVWTDEQVKSLASLVAWLAETHGFPLVKATGPQGTGVGYHRQFTSETAPRWNESHACPGDRRIAQMSQIIAQAKEISHMPSAKEVVDELLSRQVPLTDGEVKAGHYTGHLGGDDGLGYATLVKHAAIGGRQVGADVVPTLARLNTEIQALTSLVQALTEKVDSLPKDSA